ncbi:MAG: DUF2075 domain-containing protein [Spirochaetes bacterium]|nr:DUF2075 domain-containing protein [Spirochaetota bacterium]
MGLFTKILNLLKSNANFSEIKNNLLLADIDLDTINYIEKELKNKKELKDILKSLIIPWSFIPDKNKKNIFLIIGVNGSGKTTLISKISKYYKDKGYNILVSGADTFRAAAIDQLKHWCEKNKIDFISNIQGADPASVIFDSMTKFLNSNYNILIIDTAGRLQNKEELNQQLKKIDKVIRKKIDEYNKEKYNLPDNKNSIDKKTDSNTIESINYKKILVIDANIGKNSIQQAEIFNNIIGIDSFSITKLDSTAKGGSIYNICKKLNLSLSYVSFGEKIENIITPENPDFIEFLINKI